MHEIDKKEVLSEFPQDRFSVKTFCSTRSDGCLFTINEELKTRGPLTALRTQITWKVSSFINCKRLFVDEMRSKHSNFI